MKRYVYVLALALFVFKFSFAQPIPHQSIEDSVIGWIKVYNFKGVRQGMKVDSKLYAASQLSLCDSFANWMQASYMPKGGLGDVRKTVTERLGLYNQYTEGKPQAYGADAITYMFLKYNSSHKIVPENNLGVNWEITANGIPGDWPVRDICTSTQYYFTMPLLEGEGKIEPQLDVTKNVNTKRYLSLRVENMGFGGGRQFVILCKDNVSPFVKLSKGEYLNALETGIPVFYNKEKKKIVEANPGNQRSIDFLVKELDGKVERFRTGLQNNREKYKHRLEEIALTGKQPVLNDLDNGSDVFGGQKLTDPESTMGRFPVYKVDPLKVELCKKDKPQWILVGWDYAVSGPMERQLHEAIMNNFNFEYVYYFFFDPEKIRGLPYKPLRSPIFKQAVAISEASEATTKNRRDNNIYFFEDFSTTTIGEKPVGWKTKLAPDGSTSVVKTVDGLAGKWAMMGNSYFIAPDQLKGPLPQNFTLSFELVATQNFTWGSKGLTLQLSKETTPGTASSYLRLKLRPGFDGRDGEAEFETKFTSPPGYLTDTKWFDAKGFSNNKKNNYITVTIIKHEERLQVFIDRDKIVEYEKAVPPASSFNAMTFSNGSLGVDDRYYISNIKITRD